MKFQTLIAAAAGAGLVAPAIASGTAPGDDRDATIDALRRQIADLQAAVAGLRAGREGPKGNDEPTGAPAAAARAAIDESRVIDLTYPFNAASIYWPARKHASAH